MATVIEKESIDEWAKKLMAICEELNLIPVIMDKVGTHTITNISKGTKKTSGLRGLKYTVSAFLAEDGFNTENRINAFHNAIIIGFINREFASDAVIDIYEGKEPKLKGQQTLEEMEE